MNREDIYDGVTGIRDDLVTAGEKTLKRKRPARRLWIGAAAAVLALAVLAGVLLRPGGLPDAESGTDARDLTASATEPAAEAPRGGPGQSPKIARLAEAAIVEPVYPQMAQYPDFEDFEDAAGVCDLEAYGQARDAWQADRRALQPGTDLSAETGDWMQRCAGTFLSGTDGENKVCSPVNLYMALAMLAEVTDGDSRAQLLSALGAEDVEALRTRARDLWRAHYCDDGTYTCRLADALWLADDVAYDRQTLERLAEIYCAGSFRGQMGSEAYDEALREWLDSQTGGLLSDQISGLGFDPQTVLGLTSTVYFKAGWELEFWKTRKDVFHEKTGDRTVTYLCSTEDGDFYEGSRFTAAGKSFSWGGTMYFLLPAEGTDAEALLSDPEVRAFLSGRTGRLQTAHETRRIDLQVPQFDVSSQTDLVPGLEELGVTDVFDPERSDFSPLTEQVQALYVSRATHGARVKIDEHGCIGAAFTMMTVESAEEAEPPQPAELILDRPFLFCVESESGLPLFTGIVNVPEQ